MHVSGNVLISKISKLLDLNNEKINDPIKMCKISEEILHDIRYINGMKTC